MYKNDTLNNEEENKRRGLIFSILAHLLILLIVFIPLLNEFTPIESEGILIAFGDPDVGSSSESELIEEFKESAVASNSSSPSKQSNEVSSETKEEEAPIKAADKKKNTSETKKSSDSKVNNAASEAKAKAESDRLAKLAAEKAKADREAKEAEDRANKKKQYSDLFGSGKGNTNTSGNSGSNSGDPDGKALDGISKGSGRVGGGLNGRGVEYEPSFTDTSQKTGKVSLSICVNSEGKVSKAEFTQKGSTTSDSYLIELARKTAMKYRFSKSEIDSQCGTVTVDFRVQ